MCQTGSMTDTPKNHTHTAYGFGRIGKKSGRLLAVGTGYIDRDRDIAHVFMDRTVFGWSGYVVLSPHGVKPPPPAEPQRPGDGGDDRADGDS
jgi:hypothetical protein